MYGSGKAGDVVSVLTLQPRDEQTWVNGVSDFTADRQHQAIETVRQSQGGGQTSMQGAMPNIFYVGTSKAGSTWLAEVLKSHRDVYVPQAKDLYYWDRYYDRGLTWYLKFFLGAHRFAYRADISHDYMYSRDAIARIAHACPTAKILVQLRDPADRAISTYRYLKRNGQVRSGFWQAVEKYPEIIGHGYYARPLENLYAEFCRANIFIGLFDDLQEDAVAYGSGLLRWLDLDDGDVDDAQLSVRSLPASSARSARIARLVKRGAVVTRHIGFPGIVGRAKRSKTLRALLYREGDEGETSAEEIASTVDELMDMYREDVKRASAVVGQPLTKRWGYE